MRVYFAAGTGVAPGERGAQATHSSQGGQTGVSCGTVRLSQSGAPQVRCTVRPGTPQVTANACFSAFLLSKPQHFQRHGTITKVEAEARALGVAELSTFHFPRGGHTMSREIDRVGPRCFYARVHNHTTAHSAPKLGLT